MAMARASLNVMKCGVRVRWGTRRHVFNASPADIHNDGVYAALMTTMTTLTTMTTRLPMQLPLTL
jgi:hypothetical protein